MKIINNIRTYIKEDEFKLTILKNKINVLNYSEVSHFDSNEIRIKHLDGEVSINGSDLVISRLMKDELLITGNLEKIELG